MLSTVALVELFLKAQAVEQALRGAMGGAEEKEVHDAYRHATVTRRSLESWIAARRVREVVQK